MKEYKREYPLFSLCGLNCGLCPRYQSAGESKCPGCGGKDFHLLHPSCAVITCSKKHDNVEYCFECKNYPCDRYSKKKKKDSFITYRKVQTDMHKAFSAGIEKYQAELNEKTAFLELLINNYNDGRKKGFYCLAVSLLELTDLLDIKAQIEKLDEALSKKEKLNLIEVWFEEKAKSNNIDLKLRK